MRVLAVPASLALNAGAHRVAHQNLPESRCQLWREIAGLIGVCKQHERRLRRPDQLFAGRRESIGRVTFQKIVLDAPNFRDSPASGVCRQYAEPSSKYRRFYAGSQFRRQLLARGQALP